MDEWQKHTVRPIKVAWPKGRLRSLTRGQEPSPGYMTKAAFAPMLAPTGGNNRPASVGPVRARGLALANPACTTMLLGRIGEDHHTIVVGIRHHHAVAT